MIINYNIIKYLTIKEQFYFKDKIICGNYAMIQAKMIKGKTQEFIEFISKNNLRSKVIMFS